MAVWRSVMSKLIEGMGAKGSTPILQVVGHRHNAPRWSSADSGEYHKPRAESGELEGPNGLSRRGRSALADCLLRLAYSEGCAERREKYAAASARRATPSTFKMSLT